MLTLAEAKNRVKGEKSIIAINLYWNLFNKIIFKNKSHPHVNKKVNKVSWHYYVHPRIKTNSGLTFHNPVKCFDPSMFRETNTVNNATLSMNIIQCFMNYKLNSLTFHSSHQPICHMDTSPKTDLPCQH